MRYLLLLVLFAAPLTAATYDIGPGQTYTSIGAFPWENLAAGDIVNIHYRATPYAEKFVICAQGTQANPIVVQGVPDAGTGALPVLTGNNATTRSQLDYWNQNRCVIKVGGASVPSDTTPTWITIRDLEIRSAHPSYSFTTSSGSTDTYTDSASAIYVEKGKNICVINCEMHDCGNGFFVAPGGGWGSASLSEDIYVGYCYLHSNGVSGSILQHTSYCEAYNIIYEYNRFGPLMANAGGGSLKDRSAGCIVRYNWIEGGNRQLDLVEADGSGIEQAPNYDETFVYGNILIEPNGAGNSQIVHYGGDNGTTSYYRKGTLYFYNNTIYSTRTGNTTLMRLSTNSETCDCRNNIFQVTANGSNQGLIDDTGTLNLRNNWFKTGYVDSHSGAGMSGTVNDISGNITGSAPGFNNVGNQDFTLTAPSACVDAGTGQNSNVLPTHDVTMHYVKHQQDTSRPTDATIDMGAFERGTGGSPTIPNAASGLAATDGGSADADLSWTDNSSNENGFRIERDSGSGFTTAGTVGQNVTTFTDTGLTAGNSYTYRIVAYNGAGDASPSNTDSVTPTGGSGGGGGSSGGGGDSGGGGGGCSAAAGSAWWLLLLLPLALLHRPRRID